MKRKSVIILYSLFLVMGCVNKGSMQNINSPLATVIKLKAAEVLMDYTEAKNYIDINSVYGGKNSIDSLPPEQAWMEMVSFMSNTTDKKFTRQFKYYDYDVIESISSNNKAEVFFRPKNSSNKGITYKLELRKDVWIVYEIDYKT